MKSVSCIKLALMLAVLAQFLTVVSTNADSLSSGDNKTEMVYIGGKEQQNTVIQKTINTGQIQRVVYRAKQAVDQDLAGKEGRLFVLIGLEGEPTLAPYVFARPSDDYLASHSESPLYLRLFAEKNDGTILGYPVLTLAPGFSDYCYTGRILSENEEDIEFIIEGLEGFNGYRLALETTVYYEDTESFEPIQKVELDFVSGPVCGDSICEALERESDGFCFLDCCGDGYCASVEQEGQDYCSKDCCGDGYCASLEQEGENYCHSDCCGDGLCAPNESDTCPEDCFSELTCPPCPYEIQVQGLEDEYKCTDECPGYVNGELVWGFEQIESINTRVMPVYPKDLSPINDENYAYIPTGGDIADIKWTSFPKEVKIFRFIYPAAINLRETLNDEWVFYHFGYWNFSMATTARGGTGVNDLIIKYVGSQCNEPPPTIEDYYEIRDRVWSSNDRTLCYNINGACKGKLYDEDIWFELGYHIPDPDTGAQPGSGLELGDTSQSILIEQLENALPGCYYAMVVNWSEQLSDPGIRVRTSGTWYRDN